MDFERLEQLRRDAYTQGFLDALLTIREYAAGYNPKNLDDVYDLVGRLWEHAAEQRSFALAAEPNLGITLREWHEARERRLGERRPATDEDAPTTA